MHSHSNYIRGILLTALGVLILTPDALLIRLIQADLWTLLFWRGLLQGVTLTLYFVASHRKEVGKVFHSIGWPGLWIALAYALGNVMFISAIRLTLVANALIIVAASPLLAAVFSWIFLREKVPLRTWLAILVGMLGVGIIVSGSLGRGSVVGDLAAFGAAVTMGGCFVMIRRSRTINMVPAVALSGFFVAIFAGPLATPWPLVPMDMVYLALLGVVIMPISFGLITLGPRYLPAPEVGLIMLGETLLGPVWVWMVLGESLSGATWLGGGLILVTLMLHTGIAMYKRT